MFTGIVEEIGGQSALTLTLILIRGPEARTPS